MGRAIAHVYESGYLDVGKSLKMTLYKGFLSGFAGVLGATIGIALLLGVLSLFEEVPFLGNVAEKVYDTIQSSTQ
jgi:zinc transporter ZupT